MSHLADPTPTTQPSWSNNFCLRSFATSEFCTRQCNLESCWQTVFGGFQGSGGAEGLGKDCFKGGQEGLGGFKHHGPVSPLALHVAWFTCGREWGLRKHGCSTILRNFQSGLHSTSLIFLTLFGVGIQKQRNKEKSWQGRVLVHASAESYAWKHWVRGDNEGILDTRDTCRFMVAPCKPFCPEPFQNSEAFRGWKKDLS